MPRVSPRPGEVLELLGVLPAVPPLGLIKLRPRARAAHAEARRRNGAVPLDAWQRP
jgi:hypothetical protein